MYPKLLVGGRGSKDFVFILIYGIVLLTAGLIVKIKLCPKKGLSFGQQLDEYCKKTADGFFYQKYNDVANSGKVIGKTYVDEGYAFSNMFKTLKRKTDSDKKERSTAYRFAISLFVGNTVYYFAKFISLISDEKYEIQKEIPIKDIHTFSVEITNNTYAVKFNMLSGEDLYIICRSENDAKSFYNDIRMIKEKK